MFTSRQGLEVRVAFLNFCVLSFYFPSLAYAVRFPFVLCSATVEVNNPKERWLFD